VCAKNARHAQFARRAILSQIARLIR
jgi:hypothetical protein